MSNRELRTRQRLDRPLSFKGAKQIAEACAHDKKIAMKSAAEAAKAAKEAAKAAVKAARAQRSTLLQGYRSRQSQPNAALPWLHCLVCMPSIVP